jgi:tRNA(His) guanylyltransferase
MSQKYENDSLGTRMKMYEVVAQNDLMRRTPVIIRIDGKAFHTFTRCLKHIDSTLVDTPFSGVMHSVMMYTTMQLVKNVQNCVLGYTQSDEISLLLRDYDTLETQPWFGNNVQKMTSISASIATAAFNYAFAGHKQQLAFADMAMFDSRAYNLPKEEVTNYFIWRQQDASRNSVQMLGHFHFTQKQMHGKNNNQVQDMLMWEKAINWNDIPTWMKRGSCVVRSETGIAYDEGIPIFTQDRSYIDRHVLSPITT